VLASFYDCLRATLCGICKTVTVRRGSSPSVRALNAVGARKSVALYNENIRRKFEMFSNTPVEVLVCSVVE
jgi:hypothetical protein